MPNKLMKWDFQSNSGNPTKSVIINELFKRVKQHKVRRESKVSSARWVIEISKILEVVKRCWRLLEYHLGRFTGVAYLLFQFHMIARLDDVEHFKCKDLTAYIVFLYTLKSKMRWSKNILKERESPDQITIGSMDSNFFVILALALHLVHSMILKNQDSNPMLFSLSKMRIGAPFEEIMGQQDFPLSQSSRWYCCKRKMEIKLMYCPLLKLGRRKDLLLN